MSLPPARQTLAPGRLPRHRHAEGYVAVVLAGAYEEAGDAGRRRLAPGDVVVHGAWEAHLNSSRRGAQVLNLPLPAGRLAAFGRVDDVDGLVRTATRDPRAAAEQLSETFAPAPTELPDWPDRLAAALAAGDAAGLALWAETFGVSPERLSRGFGQVFGVSPKRFRAEARARAALASLSVTATPLAELALAHGFADQAHMTRAVRALSGLPPGGWRRSSPFKT